MAISTARDATALDRVVASLTGLSLLCVFVLPSQSGASFPTYLLAVAVLLSGRDRWAEFFESRILSVLFVALLVYFSSSVWWSADYTSRGAFSIYSRCLLMLAFVVALSTTLRRVPESTQWLPRLLAVAAALACAAALTDFYQNPTWDQRLAGLGQLRNSVVAGLAFDAGMIFALAVLLAGGPAWRVVGAASAALACVAVYATGSRNAYLSGAVGVWTLLLTWRQWQAPRYLWWLALPVLGLAGGVALFALNVSWAEVLLPRGGSFRLEIWTAEWQRLADQGLWFGLGVLVRDDVVLQGQDFAHPHSLYLATALQGGLVGLLLLLGVLSHAGLSLYRARRWPEARLGLALLATGASAYVFDGWELIDKVSLSWVLLWVPVAIALMVGVKSKMETTGEIESADVKLLDRTGVPAIGERR